MLCGCETDSFFDPSKTGRFEYEPTTIPVLDRLDVIEPVETAYWANATPPTAEDLMPRDLVYSIYPGDLVTISIFELTETNRWDVRSRRVDAAGLFRIPEVGDVRAAGLTAQQFEDEVRRVLREERGFTRPQVDVVVEQGGGLRYTVSGFVQRPSQYMLDNPNLRLVEALAAAGGVQSQSTERVYVVRQIILTPEAQPEFERGDREPAVRPPRDTTRPQPNIEDLLRDIEDRPPGETPTEPPPPPPPSPTEPSPTEPDIRPGMLQEPPNGVRPNGDQDQPTVDIDQLEPVRVPQEPPVDVDTVRPVRPEETEQMPIYDPERGEWIRVPGTAAPQLPPGVTPLQLPARPDGTPASILTRIIEVDYQRLYRGDASQNIVVRPNDQIYVEGPEVGFWYIEGEIARSGVFGFPTSGVLTLSRAVATAGGLGPIAEPTRVDLTRRIGKNREATIRLDLAAIRQRTEPDVVIKPDDHIIIGTSFWATPLAIFRNGFRVTYGFGFLLDRNFGPDVFGAQQGVFF